MNANNRLALAAASLSPLMVGGCERNAVRGCLETIYRMWPLPSTMDEIGILHLLNHLFKSAGTANRMENRRNDW
jgi:hypothetical protein